MGWLVLFHDDFAEEFDEFPIKVQKKVLSILNVLEMRGPSLGRCYVDTLETLQYKKMKEIRFDADRGKWRIAFIFDPQRNAILLAGGDKKGQNQRIFYEQLIAKADSRYKEHLQNLPPSGEDKNG